MLTIEYQYVRIYTNSVGMQAVVERTLAETDTDVPQDDILPMNLEPRDYDFIQEVVDGSCQILQKVVQLSESELCATHQCGYSSASPRRQYISSRV